MKKIILTVLFLCTLDASWTCISPSQVVFLLYARGCIMYAIYPQNCICIGNIYFSIGRRGDTNCEMQCNTQRRSNPIIEMGVIEMGDIGQRSDIPGKY